ncbi:MAG: hypothetical protein ACTSU4_01670 [Promethearchaeota archaeon]
MKCEVSDNSVMEIVFGEYSVFISINSKKYNTIIGLIMSKNGVSTARSKLSFT